MTKTSTQRHLPRIGGKAGLLALALFAGLGAAALGSGSAEARHGWHHRPYPHPVWGAGWFASPVYDGPYYRCRWVKQVRFIPGHGRMVRWRPLCRY